MDPNRLGAVSLLALLSACGGGGGGITNDLDKPQETSAEEDTGVPKLLVTDTDLDFGRVKLGGSSAASVTTGPEPRS